MAEPKDQQHPQYRSDRDRVNQLLGEAVSDYGLAELGRLLIRYQGFPGARDIQGDLQKVLHRWGLTQETLFAQTRALHQRGEVYQNLGRNREDWS